MVKRRGGKMAIAGGGIGGGVRMRHYWEVMGDLGEEEGDDELVAGGSEGGELVRWEMTGMVGVVRSGDRWGWRRHVRATELALWLGNGREDERWQSGGGVSE
jgi:hypothetical protein